MKAKNIEFNIGIKFANENLNQYCQITLFCVGDTFSQGCNPTICNQHPNSTWLASRDMGRTVGISSAIMYILSWVGNHRPFPRLFAWQPRPSQLGLGVQNWPIDWHLCDFGSLRHNLECYCHRLQFMGELVASSGDGLFSSLSSCSCSCSDL